MLNAKIKKSGFTIVELLIVIVVIAILAVITVVAFNGVRNQAIVSSVLSGLNSASKKLETYNINHSSYPANLDTIGVSDTDVVRYQYDGPGGENTFCLSGTSPQSSTVAYHVLNGSSDALDGVCEGHDGPGSEEGEEEEVFSFARTINSGGPLGLTVSVGEEWDAVSISWTPQEGAQKYEVQSRNPNSNISSYNTFYYRSSSTGANSCSTSCNSSYSHAISSSVSTLSWSNAATGIPKSAGQVLEYRARYQMSDGGLSDWEVVQLSNPIQADSDTRPVAGFKVTPNASYTEATLSWNQSPSFSPNMDQVFYEVQSRNPTGVGASVTEFHYRSTNSGHNSCLTTTCNNYSHSIPHETTSILWNSTHTGLPGSAGQNFEYRIRVRVAGEKIFYSPWSDVVTATYPIQSNSSVPGVTGLMVSPNSSYTNAVISWNRVVDFAPDMSKVFYEVQSRNPAGVGSSVVEFNYRSANSGHNSCGSPCTASGYTNAVPHDTTSLLWNSTHTGLPGSAGQNFEYRIRIRVAGENTYYGPWSSVVTSSYPIQSNSDVPSISNFTVIPDSSYTTATLSWSRVTNFAPDMSKVFYEVQSRNPAGVGSSVVEFNYRSANSGHNGCSTSPCGSGYTDAILHSTTSLLWNSAHTGVPASPGQSYEYRARIRVAGEKTFYSNWSPVVTVVH